MGMRWRAVASATVAAVLAVTAACGTSETTEDTAAQPTAEPTGEPTGEPTATVVDGFEWTPVELDIDVGNIAPAGDGFVGTRVPSDADQPGVIGVVATSPDGVTWTDVTDTGLASDEFVSWIVGGSGQWGAIGQVAGLDDEWLTADLLFTPDGAEFVRATVPANVTGLDGTVGITAAAVGETGTVALAGTQEAFEGYMGQPGTLGVVALFSEDLQTWEQVQIGSADLKGMPPIAASPAGFVVLGAEESIFYSPDGRQWEQVSLPVEWEPSPAEGSYVGVMSVAGWRDGFVLVTQQPSLVLTSTDGRTWTPAQSEPLPDFGDNPGGNTWALGSSLGALVVSVPFEPAQGGAAVFSSDGQTWQTWSTDDPIAWPSGGENTAMGEQAIVLRIQDMGQDGPPTGTSLWIGTPATE